MNYAGFWIRFLAYVVDSLIVSIAFFAIVALLSVMGLELISNELIFLVMGVLYYAFMQASPRQATFGKALVGLKVGGMEGERIGIGRALAREVAKIVSALTFLIGFIIAGFTTRKQALHDFIATTCVVRSQPGHVVAALAVALVALIAPFVVVFMFGAGLAAGMLGGFAGAMMSVPEMTAQAPKPAAAPAPKPAVAVTPPPAAPKPAPIPVAKPVVIPVSAPVVLAQAPMPPKPVPEPVKEPPAREEPKPAPARAETPPPAEAPPPAPMAPRVIPGPVTPGPKYNDLMTAVLYGEPRAVEELIAFGKWPDKPDGRGMTALMVAAMLGDAASAEALLKAGANPNYPGPGGITPTSLARERNDAALLGLMQRYGGR